MTMSLVLGGVAAGLLTQRIIFGWPVNRSPRQLAQWLVNAEIKQSFLHWLSGHHALANNAKVAFHWQEPCLVGNTVSFTIRVICMISSISLAVTRRFRI